MTPKDIAIIITMVTVAVVMFLIGTISYIHEKIKAKRPHKSDDEEDNPITKFKDDLADIYENYPNGKLKKLAQAVWNRVVQIEKWHNEEIHDWERKYYSSEWEVGQLNVKCERYSKELDDWVGRCKELKSKLAESEERLKRESAKAKTLESETDKLRDMLKEEREKSKIPLFSKQTEVPSYLISENAFSSQVNPFAKVILNTKPGEPLTATKAEEEALKRSVRMDTGAIIHIDSEDLNRYSTGRGPDGKLLGGEPTISDEEFVTKLRNWWGLEAGKAVELPNSIKKYVSADQLRQEYAWILALYKNPNNVPLRRFKVRVVGTYNDGKDMLHTDWILPATSINAIRNVLGEGGIQVLYGEELPI